MNTQADTRGPLADPDDFDGLTGIYHVAAAGETPLLKSQKSVFERFMTDKTQGMSGRERIFERVDRARRSVAALLQVTPNEVGFPLSVAHGMNVLAHSFRHQRGNVVAPQWEYPSLTYPFVTGTELTLKLVSTPDHTMDADRFAAEIDGDTRAILVSLVSYYTGERIDLNLYRELADRHGAMLVIDVSHAFGAGEFDVSLADFAFGCGYKWALGTHGAGIAYCNADRQSGWISSDSGWMSAEWVDADTRTGTVTPFRNGSRFELGNPAALNVDMLATGVDYLTRLGLANIEAHLLSMTEVLHKTLSELGLRVLTPAASSRRLGIVAFAVTDEAHWRKELEARRILGWVGDKRVRLSPHVYNSLDDIAAVQTAIAEIAAARPEAA